MKRKILILIMLVVTMNCMADNKYKRLTSYFNPFNNKEYSVLVNNGDQIEVIRCRTELEPNNKFGSFILVKASEFMSFNEAMYKAADKFDEWVKVAQDNNMQDLYKGSYSY